ncbi:hypothetical protein ABK040_012614 [Willaertia magna]
MSSSSSSNPPFRGKAISKQSSTNYSKIVNTNNNNNNENRSNQFIKPTTITKQYNFQREDDEIKFSSSSDDNNNLNNNLPDYVTVNLTRDYKCFFPYEPYPTQIQFMNKIIETLDETTTTNNRHALLESPTGTGKTLSLLCATLCWQQNFKAKLIKEWKDKNLNNNKRKIENNEYNDNKKIKSINTTENNDSTTLTTNENLAEMDIDLELENNQFNNNNMEKDAITTNNNNNQRKEFIEIEENNRINRILQLLQKGFTNKAEKEILKVHALPVIYYCSRTHSQIKQIIKELKKTAYRPRMTILASKQHTCINQQVINTKDINNECHKLVDSASCAYYKNVELLSTNSEFKPPSGRLQIYDIEDLLKEGKRLKSCPYYACREMLENPEIELVLCPYNYLLSPLTRENMNINLQNAIIICDEAHNIEDICRESASLSLNDLDLEEIVNELYSIYNDYKVKPQLHKPIHDFLLNLLRWMKGQRNLQELEKDVEYKVVKRKENICKVLEEMGIQDISNNSLTHFKQLKSLFFNIKAYAQSPQNKRKDPVTLSARTITILQELFYILDFLLKNNMKYINDYSLVLLKKMNDTVKSKRKNQQFTQRLLDTRVEYTLNFWCYNPAVAFEALKTKCRSVLLASGTLAPLDSFSSELGTQFSTVFEGSHIISKEQVWVGTIGTGDNGVSMNANFQNSNDANYQDSLGSMIIDLCKQIQDGILLFFPSYSFMQKVLYRWKERKILQKLQKVKDVFYEQKYESIDTIISEYYASIDKHSNSSNNSPTTTNGALFMAVCRGKVSEGIDFSNDKCRAVICIGIPYPNFKDLQVSQKREYNDENYSSNRMNGEAWYNSQAFRALNQAVGRCIRHRHDYGAIILIEERLQKNPRTVQSFSKWIRSHMTHYSTHKEAIADLKTFFNNLKRNNGVSSIGQSQISNSGTPSPVSVKMMEDDEPLKMISSDEEEVKPIVKTPKVKASKYFSKVQKNQSVESDDIIDLTSTPSPIKSSTSTFTKQTTKDIKHEIEDEFQSPSVKHEDIKKGVNVSPLIDNMSTSSHNYCDIICLRCKNLLTDLYY